MAKRSGNGSSKGNGAKQVEAFSHKQAQRKNIPSAEHEALLRDSERSPVQVAYQRRNRDLDPQLVWRGKDQQDSSDLVVQAPPLYIQEKVHPKALIDDLRRVSREREQEAGGFTPDLFADFNGIPKGVDKTEFYKHDQNWSNRMILGDSLQVMASLAEREGLRGKVQCIYLDPPYGIKFNSNFQWSTTSRDVKDGKSDHITREPEQVKAFRDTWRDGIHSYLTHLRDRFATARDLLAEAGSIFVQIGDDNVHRVRAVMDEIFGEEQFCSQIVFRKTTGKGSAALDSTYDTVLWYARSAEKLKYRPVFEARSVQDDENLRFVQLEDGSRRRLTDGEVLGSDPMPRAARPYRPNPLTNQRPAQGADLREFFFQGRTFTPGAGTFRTDGPGMVRLAAADRLIPLGRTLCFLRYLDDFPCKPRNNIWDDTRQSGFGEDKVYVVQTATKIVARCVLMTTDPGDLVLDPTCGSGTTAYVAEQWGRRWITIDTSRVALALARARIMSARYPYYLLADSRDGQRKECEITGKVASVGSVQEDIRQGFVYERVPRVKLKAIANNAEIDVIWQKWQVELEPVLGKLNQALKKKWQEWEIPRQAEDGWPAAVKKLHATWWEGRIARQKEIDASIASKADSEYLYDRPYEDKKTVRVAGPFTVESLSPHRVLGVDENDELIDPIASDNELREKQSFPQMVIDNLRTAGVQQAHKDGKINFTSVNPWPGDYVSAEGRYREGENGPEKRAGILVGPEFGTVTRPDLVAAAKEAAEAGFDVLVACAFNYEAHATEFNKLGRVPVLKARMNADLHMAEDLKNTGKGNLFVVFGEPDIDLLKEGGGRWRVKVKGVDVFHPTTGKVESSGPDGIACWFVDTDYDEESFFVRQAYFLGANDPYSALRTTLKADIDAEAWESLHSDTSRSFEKPKSGRIAVKVINHLGDEVMKVFRVP